MDIVKKEVLRKVYTKRHDWVHKGDFGKLAIIGGSKILTGSCCFSAMSAYRAGCDVVYVIAPKRAADVAAHYSPNIITIPIEDDYFKQDDIDYVISKLEKYGITAVVLGPAIGRKRETELFVHDFLQKNKLPIIIDADGIRAFASMPIKLKTPTVFTPHAEEFRILCGTKLDTEISKRTKQVEAVAKKLNATIVAKGYFDIISDGKKTILNKTGSIFMTKGGMGDTLAGIIGAYLARGINAYDSGCVGTFVNGKAGELASKKLRESTLATDLMDSIYQAIKLK